MSHFASPVQWLVSHCKQAYRLPEPVLPIRATYKPEDALYDLAKSMASGEQLDLPQYVPFSFREKLTRNEIFSILSELWMPPPATMIQSHRQPSG